MPRVAVKCPTAPLPSHVVGLLKSFEAACTVATNDYEQAKRRGAEVVVPRRATDHVVPPTWHVAFANGDAPEPITVFHSAAVPAIALPALAQHICRAVFFEPGTVEAAVALCGRYAAHTDLPATAMMKHRMLVAAMLVAGKMHQDVVPTTHQMAKAAGLQVPELKRLEFAFLQGIDWRAVVTEEDVDGVTRSLNAMLSCSAADDSAEFGSGSSWIPAAGSSSNDANAVPVAPEQQGDAEYAAA